MRTSAHGIKLLEAREGIRLKVYKDSKGLPTVGVGHLVVPTDGLKVGDKITQAQCDAFLASDLKECENAVNDVGVALKQNQFDALVSFIFNIGVGGFLKSTVRKKLKNKDYTGAANAMLMWVKPPEIKGRRQTEVNQFLHPDRFYTSSAAVEATPPESIPPPVDSVQPPTLWDKCKDTWSKVTTWRSKVDEVQEEGSALQNTLSPISKVSKFNFVSLKVMGWVTFLGGFLYAHRWQIAIMGVILIALAVYHWNRSRDRQLARG